MFNSISNAISDLAPEIAVARELNDIQVKLLSLKERLYDLGLPEAAESLISIYTPSAHSKISAAYAAVTDQWHRKKSQ